MIIVRTRKHLLGILNAGAGEIRRARSESGAPIPAKRAIDFDAGRMLTKISEIVFIEAHKGPVQCRQEPRLNREA